jgi:hypothetical protein
LAVAWDNVLHAARCGSSQANKVSTAREMTAETSGAENLDQFHLLVIRFRLKGSASCTVLQDNELQS